MRRFTLEILGKRLKRANTRLSQRSWPLPHETTYPPYFLFVRQSLHGTDVDAFFIQQCGDVTQ